MKALKKMWEQYKKPTHPKWRKIGDYILLVTAFIDATLPTIPVTIIPEDRKVLVGAISTFIGITLKFWTNTRKGPDEGSQNEAEKKTDN